MGKFSACYVLVLSSLCRPLLDVRGSPQSGIVCLCTIVCGVTLSRALSVCGTRTTFATEKPFAGIFPLVSRAGSDSFPCGSCMACGGMSISVLGGGPPGSFMAMLAPTMAG